MKKTDPATVQVIWTGDDWMDAGPDIDATATTADEAVAAAKAAGYAAIEDADGGNAEFVDHSEDEDEWRWCVTVAPEED
jgi:hypothetical protein